MPIPTNLWINNKLFVSISNITFDSWLYNRSLLFTKELARHINQSLGSL